MLIYYILVLYFLQEVEQEVTRPLLKVWPLPEKATQFPFPDEESPDHKMWEPRNTSQVGHHIFHLHLSGLFLTQYNEVWTRKIY